MNKYKYCCKLLENLIAGKVPLFSSYNFELTLIKIYVCPFCGEKIQKPE